MIYFTGDLHLGHKAICKYREGFDSIEAHDEHIFEKIAWLGKHDILYLLGDIVFDSDKYSYYIDTLSKMRCRYKLLMGNHDSLKLYNEPRFEIQLPLCAYKSMWLSHCPIHPNEIRNRICNIHGHVHMKAVNDIRYVNASIDYNGYNLLSLDEIREYKFTPSS